MTRLSAIFGKKVKGNPASWLVVGLGNPGEQYKDTRHNLGARVIESIVARAGTRLKKSKYNALISGVNLDGQKIVFAFPTTFMNESGLAVRKLVDTFGVVEPANVIIIHDELDLAVGVVKVKLGGGLAGHNGLKSVKQYLSTSDFVRVRVGIDRPTGSRSVSDYVLSKPAKSELEQNSLAIDKAADAVEMIIRSGVDKTMALVNAN